MRRGRVQGEDASASHLPFAGGNRGRRSGPGRAARFASCRLGSPDRAQPSRQGRPRRPRVGTARIGQPHHYGPGRGGDRRQCGAWGGALDCSGRAGAPNRQQMVEGSAADRPGDDRILPPRSRGGGGRRFAVGPDLGSKPKRSEGRPSRGHTGFWLKMVYDSEERRGLEWWTRQDWLNDRHLMRGGKRPILRPSYREGDLLVLYVVGRGCPAIVEVTRPAEFEPERVRADPGSRPDDWRLRGWVTKMVCRQSVSLVDAPTLRDIEVAASSVKRRGRIRLRPEQFALARSELLRR